MEEMERKAKKVKDVSELMALMPLIAKFPPLHNKIKAEFKVVLDIAEQLKDDPTKFSAQCNACLNGLFSLIETDLYYYNQFDPYEDYNDRDRFFSKLKSTFKQICKTWDREQLQADYFNNSLGLLKELKDKRDGLTHPKVLEDVSSNTYEDLQNLKRAFQEYDAFFSKIMENFFFETTIPFSF